MTDKVKLGMWDEFTGGYLPVDVEKLLSGLENMEYTRVGNNQEVDSKLKPLSAVDPDHYDFPGGVQVKDISAHLTSFGGQALQYIARATRLDGMNKGDQVTDLWKAVKLLEWEIERMEGVSGSREA